MRTGAALQAACLPCNSKAGPQLQTSITWERLLCIFMPSISMYARLRCCCLKDASILHRAVASHGFQGAGQRVVPGLPSAAAQACERNKDTADGYLQGTCIGVINMVQCSLPVGCPVGMSFHGFMLAG